MNSPLQFVNQTWQLVVSSVSSPMNEENLTSVNLSTLEDRVLYDASPLAAIAGDISESIEALDEIDQQLEEFLDDQSYVAATDLAPTKNIDAIGDNPDQLLFEPARQLIFIDERLGDFESLVDDILSSGDSATKFDIVRLDQFSNGIETITEALQGSTKYDAVHIVGHGSDADMQLGSTRLNQENISDYTAELSTWTSGMALGADILIYGCDVAETQEGKQFVDQLALLTGVDVAASDDLTGNAQLGGDWDFEYTVGLIETEIAFSQSIQTSYFGTFATITVDSLVDETTGDTSSVANLIANDGGDGISLREAIIAANADGAADTILLGAGTHGLSLSGAGNALGDLDLFSNIEIIGLADGTSVIDAQGIDRVFHVQTSTATLRNLTIQGGDAAGADGGGGVLIASGASVILDRVTVTANTAFHGGGI